MGIAKGYDSIAGYKDIKAMLKRTAKMDKGFHAYIFNGEPGCGKGTLAYLFAMALLCKERTGEPCMECSSCKKALSGNLLDIIWVTHEKPDSLGVDEIRKQLVDDIYIKPFESEYKIYIVQDASLMTPQAQNAILKTLEEPPVYGIIILLTDNMDVLLPTIVSRCNTITFNPLSDDVVSEYLINEFHISEYYAKIYAAFAMGKIGVARKIAESSDFLEKLQEGIHYIKNSHGMSSSQRIDIAKKLSADKKEIYDYLEIFTIWFRDVLYYKATMDAEEIILKEERSAIKKRASVSSYEGLQKIIDAIYTARMRLKANVNPELVMELLFMTISEN
jgi:DNA polymerase-3 subunit delta'